KPTGQHIQAHPAPMRQARLRSRPPRTDIPVAARIYSRRRTVVPPLPTLTAADRGMSRRQLMRNAGIAGAAAWVAPAILASRASPAAAASGCTCDALGVGATLTYSSNGTFTPCVAMTVTIQMWGGGGAGGGGDSSGGGPGGGGGQYNQTAAPVSL